MYSNNLYEARKQARKTQAELAEMLAMNTIVYGRYERGERDIPLSVAVQMADVLNVSLDYLAGRSRIASGTKSDDEFLQKTLIDPAMKNVTSERDALYAYVNVLREEQRKTNEQTENAVAQIMKIINDKYPSE
jgi:transcriptional regulator with XRE-family HTH domain